MVEKLCDRCDSMAKTTFARENGAETEILGFCGHHTNQYVVALTVDGWLILEDTREWKPEQPDPRTTAAVSETAGRQSRGHPSNGPGEDDGGGVTASVPAS